VKRAVGALILGLVVSPNAETIPLRAGSIDFGSIMVGDGPVHLEKSAKGVLLPHQPCGRNPGAAWSAKTTRPRQPIRRGRSLMNREESRSYASDYRMARVSKLR